MNKLISDYKKYQLARSIFIKIRKKFIYGLYKLFKEEISRYIYTDKIILEVIGWQNSKNYNLRKKNFLLIRRKQCHGFFSDFINVLMNISIADKFNLVPVVDIANYPSFYKEEKLINNSNNVWEYYFKQENSIEDVYKSHYILSNDSFPYPNLNQFLLKKNYFSYLFKKYIYLRPEIVNEFQEFKEKNFKDHFVIGFHWRGTDVKKWYNKKSTIDIDTISKYLDPIINSNNKVKIFLCTDEKLLLEIFIKRYKELTIYTDSYRSNSKEALHLKDTYPRENHKYKLGKEVLLDALLLSSCNMLIGRDSNVCRAAMVMGDLNLDQFIIIPGDRSQKFNFKQYLTDPFFVYGTRIKNHFSKIKKQ